MNFYLRYYEISKEKNDIRLFTLKNAIVGDKPLPFMHIQIQV